MSDRVIAIVRIDWSEMASIPEDEERFERVGLEKISLLIPRVRVLSGIGYKKEKYEEKPLLLNYGFISIPLEYARNKETLRYIVDQSKVISGFIMRSDLDLEEEKTDCEDHGHTNFFPVLVEQVTSHEAARLDALSHNINVHEGVDGITIGSIVLLQGYPFANMSGKVISKSQTQIEVRLLETGFVAKLKPEQLYYKNS